LASKQPPSIHSEIPSNHIAKNHLADLSNQQAMP